VKLSVNTHTHIPMASSASSIGIYGIEVTPRVTKMQLAVPPPHAAASDGDIDTIKRLIAEAGEGILSVTDGNGWTPVHVAARAHPSPRTRTCWLLLLVYCLCQAAQHLLAADEVFDCRLLCIGTGQLDLLKFVSELVGISSLTTRTRQSMTPAHLAARGGHLEVVKFLVDTLGPKILLARDADGWTAAHSGARTGDLIMLKYISETVGVIALSGSDDGPTLMQVAKKSGHSDAVQYLKEMTYQIDSPVLRMVQTV